jgi:hypothetical protein
MIRLLIDIDAHRGMFFHSWSVYYKEKGVEYRRFAAMEVLQNP